MKPGKDVLELAVTDADKGSALRRLAAELGVAAVDLPRRRRHRRGRLPRPGRRTTSPSRSATGETAARHRVPDPAAAWPSWSSWPTCSADPPPGVSRRATAYDCGPGRPVDLPGMSTIRARPTATWHSRRTACHSGSVTGAELSTNGWRVADPPHITFLTIRVSGRIHVGGVTTLPRPTGPALAHLSRRSPVNPLPSPPRPGGGRLVRRPSAGRQVRRPPRRRRPRLRRAPRRDARRQRRRRDTDARPSPERARGAGPAAGHPGQRAQGRRLQGHRPRGPRRAAAGARRRHRDARGHAGRPRRRSD